MNTNNFKIPLLAVTMGDPAGVGPEVIVRSWLCDDLQQLARRFVVGRPAVMRRAIDMLGLNLSIVEVNDLAKLPDSNRAIPVLTCGSIDADESPLAAVDPRSGQAAVDALRMATDLALSGDVDAIVTAPLHKVSLRQAGFEFPGHTELLADWCDTDRYAMMLYLDQSDKVLGEIGLGVIHATLHTGLKSAIEKLSQQAILDKSQLAYCFTRAMLKSRAIDRQQRIAVAALNPHGGEQGLFGDEESRIIEPAVKIGNQRGWKLSGPLPTDTLMHRAVCGEFDAVVAMYHDQGHIALKLLGFHEAVNITLGLPIIRTSVAHGTAFDLAWKSSADCRSMHQATKVAVELVRGARILELGRYGHLEPTTA